MTDTILIFINAVLAVTALTSAVISIINAISAKKSAAKTAELAQESVIAFERTATANETMAMALKEANDMRSKPVIEFAVQQRSKNKYILANVGNFTAKEVSIVPVAGIIHPTEEKPIDIVPGNSISFMVIKTMGNPDAKIKVTYIDESSGVPEPKFIDYNIH